MLLTATYPLLISPAGSWYRGRGDPLGCDPPAPQDASWPAQGGVRGRVAPCPPAVERGARWSARLPPPHRDQQEGGLIGLLLVCYFVMLCCYGSSLGWCPHALITGMSVWRATAAVPQWIVQQLHAMHCMRHPNSIPFNTVIDSTTTTLISVI